MFFKAILSSCPTIVASGMRRSTYFFTVNLTQQHNNDLLARHIETLRNVVRSVRSPGKRG
jgi:hypothetical protein